MFYSLRFCLLCILLLFTFQAQCQQEKVYTFSHPEKVYDFKPYKSASIEQTVERVSDKEVIVRVNFSGIIEAPKSAYPIQNLGAEFQQYLEPASHIESDHPKILQIAEQIKSETKTSDLNELVKSVLRWNINHLTYGNPNAIHSAVEALEQQVVNCIGYSHLPAAILRQLGVPTRVMRTFVINGRFITRHYMLEVYFPEQGYWLTIEPQTGSLPFSENVILYVDEDWNQEKHLASRSFSVDPNTAVQSGIRSGLEQVNEIGQVEKPSAENLSQRDLMGRVLVSNDEYLVTLGFKYPETRYAQVPNIHSHNNTIYIYKKAGGKLELTHKFNPSEGYSNDNFTRNRPSVSPIFLAGARSANGYGSYDMRPPALAMDEKVLAVGLTGISEMRSDGKPVHNGVIILYELAENDQWQFKQKLTLPENPNAVLGEAISLAGDYLFAGAPNTYTELGFGTGKVFVFKKINGSYTFQRELTPNQPLGGEYFGYSMASNTKKLMVSATYRFDNNQLYGNEKQGVVYVFNIQNDGFSQEAILKANDGHIQDMFGHSLSLYGNTLAVGAPLQNSGGDNAGAVYIFGFDGRSWTQKAKLQAENPISGDNFGAKVLLNDSHLLVSAPNMATDLGNNSGAIYQFEYFGDKSWESQRIFTSKNKIKDNPEAMHDGRENLGYDFTILDNQLIAGAPGFYSHPYNAYNNMGGMYQFSLPYRSNQLQQLNTRNNLSASSFSVNPNPFVIHSNIEFIVAEKSQTQLILKSEKGELLDILVNKELEKGTYTFTLSGTRLLPGTYLLKLAFPNHPNLASETIPLIHLDEMEIESVR